MTLPESGATTVRRLGERPMAAREKLLEDMDSQARSSSPRSRDSAAL